MMKVTSLLIEAESALWFSFGSSSDDMVHLKACVLLKVVSSEKCRVKRVLSQL